MRHKNQKPPIFVGGSENCALLCPRYMNVPSPAPCHVNVAGVGKQSVWGLRIIACSSISTVTSFPKFVNTQSDSYCCSIGEPLVGSAWRVSEVFRSGSHQHLFATPCLSPRSGPQIIGRFTDLRFGPQNDSPNDQSSAKLSYT